MKRHIPPLFRGLSLATLAGLWVGAVHAITPLADQPLFASTGVPGNLALALSVEFPTAISVAHIGAFVTGQVYRGYFDHRKCYRYHVGTQDTPPESPGPDVSHFFPVGKTNAAFECTGAGLTDTWSGNFMNWMIMQAVDPFRMVLTGGYRVIDEVDRTILEKAWGSVQGNENNFPNIPHPSRPSPSAAVIAAHTPLTFGSLRVSVRTRGNQVHFTETGDINAAATHYNPSNPLTPAVTYRFFARVRVCVPTIAGLTPAEALEPNCRAYPSGHWKPEGLMQEYSDRMRFSVFGYLNDSNLQRDGGVLRARQKFIGPTVVNPGNLPTANANAEWSPLTGVMLTNPDTADAAATAAAWGIPIANSGALNYVNKFGQIVPGTYKTFDPVGELYYAALRYLRGLPNVTAWSDPNVNDAATRVTRADGFPVITDWNDPVQYSCQRNFVLGIGDVNTHADKNVPGTAISTTNEPARPAQVSSDTAVDARTMTDRVGLMQGMGAGLGSVTNVGGCCNHNAALMAGLAFHANTRDVRPDLPGRQTIQTYWLDILEFQTYKPNNQFYLAAKFGGFTVPEGFDPDTWSGPLPDDWWHTNGENVGSGANLQKRPDNYYTAARPDQLIEGLERSFAQIAAQVESFTTSFASALPQVSLSGNASYSARFNSGSWTGEVSASALSFSATDGTPSLTPAWSFSSVLGEQLAGTGWDTARRMVTWNPSTGAGVAFRHASLNATQQAALNTPWRAVNDSADFLAYLRGQRLHERGSSEAASSKAYRTRMSLVGDIVGSKVRPVGPPAMPYSNASNPGYSAFRSARAARIPMIYVGSNAGVLHGIDGRLTGATAGREVFAYVPSALFQGPENNPAVSGLAALGNPDYQHRNYVNATPVAHDIDFGRTIGGSGTPDWRTVLLGGLGKGGRSLYAIDITQPEDMVSESAVASRVLWEFTNPDLGFTFGEPVVAKTRKHGWVVIVGSGYNNSNGQGYFFIINPRTGALLEKIGTGEGTAAAQAGLAHVNAFVLDRTDGTVDAAYAGDLLGNVWRLDLSASTGAYPAPLRLAQLRSATNEVQPVTTRPLIEVDPRTGHRFVLVGTGRLLDSSDIGHGVAQSFYALRDGDLRAFGKVSDLPGAVSWPLVRSHLANNTNLLDEASYNPATQAGWYVELSSGGWRVVTEPSAAMGVVTFAATRPGGDVCNLSGSARVYAIRLGTGRSVLTSGVDTFINYLEVPEGVVTDLRFFSVNGVGRLVAGSDDGQTRPVQGVFNTATGVRRLNWRELPVAN